MGAVIMAGSPLREATEETVGKVGKDTSGKAQGL